MKDKIKIKYGENNRTKKTKKNAGRIVTELFMAK